MNEWINKWKNEWMYKRTFYQIELSRYFPNYGGILVQAVWLVVKNVSEQVPALVCGCTRVV